MLDFSRFRWLTFDCYGTLIDWESGIFSALRPLLASHGKSLDDARLLEMYGELEAQAEEGPFRSYREVLRSVIRSFGQKLGFTPTEAEERSLPDSLKNWKPWPDTIAALNELKAAIVSGDRKSTRLNSSHEWISYAVFCLKKKKKKKNKYHNKA